MPAERLLVNFFYAQQVGHAVEALHYAHGHRAADPGRRISLALNAATAHRLADFCPWLEATYPIDHPFVEPCADSAARLRALPREWDRVLDDVRRHLPDQLAAFAGMRDYYAASDAHLVARTGRSVAGAPPAGYVPHTRLRLELPAAARAAARRRLGEAPRRIAVVPAGSSERSLYPSATSWRMILDALAEAMPGARFALIGKLARDARSHTALEPAELAALLAHPARPADCFDVELGEQVAVVEACDVLVAPHTGFGMVALAAGTPWLAISGGRWFEWFFNRVPFRSVLPETSRHPAFGPDAGGLAPDGEDGPRVPSMTAARIREDLGAIVAGAVELAEGRLPYERALAEYFPALRAALEGDATAIWSKDQVHRAYV